MIGVIVLKQFQKFVKVKNGTSFKNSLFFYFMLKHHLSNVEHGVTILEPDKAHMRTWAIFKDAPHLSLGHAVWMLCAFTGSYCFLPND